jgi:hypothetical protein
MEKDKVAQKHPERLDIPDAPISWKYEGYTEEEIDAMIEEEKEKLKKFDGWPDPKEYPDFYPKNI